MGRIQENLREIHQIGKQTRERLVTVAACPLLARYAIGSAGFSEAKAGFQWVRRQPAMSMVLLCLNGEGHVWLHNQWQRCQPGMAYVTPPNMLHAYHALEGTPWDLCWVTFEGTTSATIITATEPTLLVCDPQPLQHCIGGLYRECIGDRDAAAIHHWSSLLHLHVRRLTPTRHNADSLHRLWETIDADLAHPWTLTDLTRLAAMSDETLRIQCHQHFSRSPMQQVTYLRMQRAGYLLRTTGWSIPMIAQNVGYDSSTAFASTFKRWMGISPIEYRRKT